MALSPLLTLLHFYDALWVTMTARIDDPLTNWNPLRRVAGEKTQLVEHLLYKNEDLTWIPKGQTVVHTWDSSAGDVGTGRSN